MRSKKEIVAFLRRLVVCAAGAFTSTHLAHPEVIVTAGVGPPILGTVAESASDNTSKDLDVVNGETGTLLGKTAGTLGSPGRGTVTVTPVAFPANGGSGGANIHQ
jgi:hypothetical protein